MISWKKLEEERRNKHTGTVSLAKQIKDFSLTCSSSQKWRKWKRENRDGGWLRRTVERFSYIAKSKFICVGEECKENTRQLKEKEMKMIRMIKRFFGGKIPLKELGEQRKLRRYFFPFERGERKI